MITICDYGSGNLLNVKNTLDRLGAPSIVTSDPETILNAEKIILPGVGAFGDAAQHLKTTGLGQAIRDRVQAGVPLLGICVGMQLLFEHSLEKGLHQGLDFFPGSVVRLENVPKIPHMGWNALEKVKSSPLFKGIQDGDFAYFVHSFHYQDPQADFVTATCYYGQTITAAVEKDHVFGVQFHPEKSGPTGDRILLNFKELS